MTNPVCFTSDLTEVFTTNNGAVYQSDRESCLFINFSNKFCRFSFKHICVLKTALQQYDVEALLLDPQSSPIEIISFPGCEHCYILTHVELAEFQDLLHGSFAMFELNNILNDCLRRIII